VIQWSGCLLLPTGNAHAYVAINQGNSGGPLLDESGKVIGIITSRALGADGIGFAVPIDQAVEQIPHILRNKPQIPPCMGCKLATLKPSLAVELNSSPEFGTHALSTGQHQISCKRPE
jgi:S1-C subfamily serine protease